MLAAAIAVDVAQVVAPESGMVEDRDAEIGLAQTRAGEIAARQVLVAQVRLEQVAARAVGAVLGAADLGGVLCERGKGGETECGDKRNGFHFGTPRAAGPAGWTDP